MVLNYTRISASEINIPVGTNLRIQTLILLVNIFAGRGKFTENSHIGATRRPALFINHSQCVLHSQADTES